MANATTIAPIYPWDDIFNINSRHVVGMGVDIFIPGQIADTVFLVEEGALVETRADNDGTSHAVALLGVGSIVGIRMTSIGGSLHEVRATALAPSVVRSVARELFLFNTMKRPELASALLLDIAHRTHITRRLSDACHQATTSKHVLDILEAVETAFGGKSGPLVGVPPALLERMCGCPWVMIRHALSELQSQGLVEVRGSCVYLVHHASS